MSTSVRDKLNKGYYKNELNYPVKSNLNKCGKCNNKMNDTDLFCGKCGTKKENTALDTYNKEMKEYKDRESERYSMFKEDALVEVELKGHSTEERAWVKAWQDGHSSGLSSVLSELEELAEVILG
jgi:hypothetical protein